MNGRDYMQLAALSSGTMASSQGVVIGGQSGTQAAFLLGGQDNDNQQISTGHSGRKEIVKLSVDAIQASQGRNERIFGGVRTVVARSGQRYSR